MSDAEKLSSDWMSLTSADLLLSLRVPRGWLARAESEHAISVLPGTEAPDGYRPTLTIGQGTPAGPGRAWFDTFAAQVPGQLAGTIEAFELIGIDEFALSSPAEAIEVRYRQHAAGAPPTSHLQAYLWCGSDRMYVVAGATSRPGEPADLPVFGAIVRSIRVLPPRPERAATGERDG